MSNIVWQPNPGPQIAFLASTAREVLYGGAAGGGKTDALLAVDLRWADHPKHRSILLRRTRPQLQESIDRSLQLYPLVVPGADWQEGKSRWEMPSGAIYQFGYAEHENDIMNYKSFEYNVIKFDELTTFTEKMYKFMFLRNRSKSAELPLWVRSGTNPGDIGHEFVFNRFIDSKEPYRIYNNELTIDGERHVITQQYIPSRVWDNPALPNRAEYIAGIMQLSEEDIAAYLYGEWTRLAGAMFKAPLIELETKGLASPNYYVIRAIDYGWDDYTCVLWLVVYEDLQIVDVAAELYVRETPLEGIAHLIKGIEADLKLRPPVYSVGSPEMGKIEGTSGQSLQTMLAILGVNVEPIKGGAGSRKTGWAQVQRYLVRGAIRLWPGAAPNLKRTLPIMMRDPKKPEDLRTRQEDHAADTLRYGLMAIVDKPKPLPTVQTPHSGDPNFDQVYDKIIRQLQKPGQQFPGLW